MRTVGKILEAIGGFSLVMTGIRLWQEGFPRLEGPEGETIANVLRILAPYAIVALISLGILGFGGYLAHRPFSKKEQMERDEKVLAFYRATLRAWSIGKLDDFDKSFQKSGKRMELSTLMMLYHPYDEIAMRTFFENFSPLQNEFLVGISRSHGWFVLTNLRLIQKDGKTNEYKEIILVDVDTFDIRQGALVALVIKLKNGSEILIEELPFYPKPDWVTKLIAHKIVLYD